MARLLIMAVNLAELQIEGNRHPASESISIETARRRYCEREPKQSRGNRRCPSIPGLLPSP